MFGDPLNLPGLRSQTRQHLKQLGIRTCTDLVARLTLDDFFQLPGVGPISGPPLYATAQAQARGEPVQYAELPAHATQPGIMYDLETAIDDEAPVARGTPWAVGVVDGDGCAEVIVMVPHITVKYLVLDNGVRLTLVPTQGSLWRAFAEVAWGAIDPVYHWSDFDARIMANHAPDDVRRHLMPRLHDLLKTCEATYGFPVGDRSLKTIASYLGFRWSGTNDCFAAYAAYLHWLDQPDDLDAMQLAVGYQADDVFALRVVQAWMADHAGPPEPM